MSTGRTLQLSAPVYSLEAGVYITGGSAPDWQRLIQFNRSANAKGPTGRWKVVETMLPADLYALILSDPTARFINPTCLPWAGELSSKQCAEKIDKRLHRIQPALDQIDKVLASPDSTKLLNRIYNGIPRKTISLQQFRLDFWSVVLFGRVGLGTRGQRIGRWDRMDTRSSATRGRPPCIHQTSCGGRNTTTEDLLIIEEVARRHVQLGAQIRDLYLRYVIRWKDHSSITNANPITYGTFWYHIRKRIGPDLQQTMKPRDASEPGGSRRKAVARYGQEFQVDAQQNELAPRSDTDSGLAPKLWVVLLVDTTTSHIAGVGFSIGVESSEAYRAALFIASVDKPAILHKLFGIHIHPDEWPSMGIPQTVASDRGSAPANLGELEQTSMPTARAKSKGAVETAHEKRPALNDRLAHRVTNRTTFDLMRAAVFRVIQQNKSKDVTESVPLDLRDRLDLCTPNQLVNAMLNCGRDASLRYTFEEAVQTFLPTRSGVIHGQTLRVGAFRFAPVNADDNELFSPQGRVVNVHFFPGSIRAAWVFIGLKLVELSLLIPTLTAERELFVSLADLDQANECRSKQKRRLRDARVEVEVDVRERHERTVGRPLDDARTKAGRAPRPIRKAKQSMVV